MSRVVSALTDSISLRENSVHRSTIIYKLNFHRTLLEIIELCLQNDGRVLCVCKY